jgi:hypothetical protein
MCILLYKYECLIWQQKSTVQRGTTVIRVSEDIAVAIVHCCAKHKAVVLDEGTAV